MGKTAASVLLNMFINGYERCRTTEAPLAQFSNVNNIQSMIPENQNNITTQWYGSLNALRFNRKWNSIFLKRLNSSTCLNESPGPIHFYYITTQKFSNNNNKMMKPTVDENQGALYIWKTHYLQALKTKFHTSNGYKTVNLSISTFFQVVCL